MNKAKKKIILAAIDLFNKEGLMNVRNAAIAEGAGMSLSNFNYHFKGKQELVHDVFEYMTEVLEEKVYGNKLLVQEGQGLEITRSYFEFEEDFRFFYLDTNNILQAFPKLKEKVKIQIQEAIQIIKNLNYMAVGKNHMKPEPENMPGLYDLLAQQIWINNHFWLAQMKIRDVKGSTVQMGLQACFTILYPYLTPAGIQVYQRFIEQTQDAGAATKK